MAHSPTGTRSRNHRGSQVIAAANRMLAIRMWGAKKMNPWINNQVDRL
ncbi:MAG: hypothetical protein ACK5OC_10260 [Pirellula sp.]